MGLIRVNVMKSSHSSGDKIYIPPSPHHPEESFRFPKRSFEKTKIVERSFQPSWFLKWPFLHYQSCILPHMHESLKKKKMKTTKKVDPSFVSSISAANYIYSYLANML